MTLYMFTIDERNGAQTYLQDVYVEAENIKEANDFAIEFASTFYEGAERNGPNLWSVVDPFGKEITWGIYQACSDPNIIIYGPKGACSVKKIKVLDA